MALKNNSPPKTNTTNLHPVERCIRDIRAGKMIIVVDDEDRENEGDLVMAASKATARAVNFMATHGRGLICVPLADETAARLGLHDIVAGNRENFHTAFTVSVDAAVGITTGISAPDRARTIRLLAAENSRASDFVRPGHVFPLIAKPGGVLQRAGHTEAAVDLARLAGLPPAGVICEILSPDGTMARLPQLKKFAARHDLKICTVAQLIEYRSRKEDLIRCLRTETVTTAHGRARLYEFESLPDKRTHFALVFGAFRPGDTVRVRVHRESAARDLFMAGLPESLLHCGLREIARPPGGIFVYMRTESMRHELSRHAATDAASGERRAALREYGLGAQILRHLGVKKICLLTRHPVRAVGLESYGLHIVQQQPLPTAPTRKNRKTPNKP
jgi:3,4-dihydroxy 2-butanone 4-phosphate synthase/GTP cyclohydrolase II